MKGQSPFCLSVAIRAEAAEYLGHGRESHPRAFDAAVSLLAALWVGPYAVRISKFTGLDRRECCWFGIEARRQGIFRQGRVDSSRWEDPEGAEGQGNVQFALDCYVLSGQLRCRRKMYSLGSWLPAASKTIPTTSG